LEKNLSEARSIVPYPKRKARTCFGCGNKSRNVTWFPLMQGFYHYECWLDTGMARIEDAVGHSTWVDALDSLVKKEGLEDGELGQIVKDARQRDLFDS